MSRNMYYILGMMIRMYLGTIHKHHRLYTPDRHRKFLDKYNMSDKLHKTLGMQHMHHTCQDCTYAL
jgi:DNA repair ATPase RecN